MLWGWIIAKMKRQSWDLKGQLSIRHCAVYFCTCLCCLPFLLISVLFLYAVKGERPFCSSPVNAGFMWYPVVLEDCSQNNKTIMEMLNRPPVLPLTFIFKVFGINSRGKQKEKQSSFECESDLAKDHTFIITHVSK